MASGRGNGYKAILIHSDVLADLLDTNATAKTKLLRKMKANEWIEPTADLSTDDLVALILKKVETEGEGIFHKLLEFLSNIVGLEAIAKEIGSYKYSYWLLYSRFFVELHTSSFCISLRG